jgi:hypothetical protein
LWSCAMLNKNGEMKVASVRQTLMIKLTLESVKIVLSKSL